MEIDIFVGNIWAPIGSVTILPTYLSVGNVYAPSQSHGSNQFVKRMFSNFSPKQTVVEDQAVINISVGNSLNLQHNAGPFPISLTVASVYFNWQQAIKNAAAPSFVQTPGWTQTVTVQVAKPTNSDYVPTGIVVYTHHILLTVSNTFAPVGYAVPVTNAGPYFIVNTGIVPAPPSKVTFTFGAFTFNVRKPDFDNTEKLQFSRVNRRSRGGDLIIFRDPMWPESIILKMQFSLLGEKEKVNFQTLFRLSLGELVTYNDYIGQTWSGIILNPGDPIVQYGIGDRYRVDVELQGGRI